MKANDRLVDTLVSTLSTIGHIDSKSTIIKTG